MEPSNEMCSLRKCFREGGEVPRSSCLVHVSASARKPSREEAWPGGGLQPGKGCWGPGSLWEQGPSLQLAGRGKAGQAGRVEAGTFQGLVWQQGLEL